MGYVHLFLAIISEVIATSALKASDGFTNPVPSVIVIVGYALAFYFLALVLKTIPVGIAYAIWAGLGIVLIAIVGVVVYGEKLDAAALLGIALIILGVVLINAFSEAVKH